MELVEKMNNEYLIDHPKYPKCIETESLAGIRPKPVKIARSRGKRFRCFMVYAAALYAAQPFAKCVEFSAEFSVIDDGEQRWEKAYIGDQQMRLESPYYPRVIDLRKNVAYDLIDKAHVEESALDRRAVERTVGGPLRDPANPCVQLQGWFSADDSEEENSPKVLHRTCGRGTAGARSGRRFSESPQGLHFWLTHRRRRSCCDVRWRASHNNNTQVDVSPSPSSGSG
jgi:hypothetical protein